MSEEVYYEQGGSGVGPGLFLDLVQGSLDLVAVLLVMYEQPAYGLIILMAFNSILGVWFVFKKYEGMALRDIRLEQLEVALRFGGALFIVIYSANAFGAGFLSRPLGGWVIWIPLVFSQLNLGPLEAWMLRFLARILEKVGGYSL